MEKIIQSGKIEAKFLWILGELFIWLGNYVNVYNHKTKVNLKSKL